MVRMIRVCHRGDRSSYGGAARAGSVDRRESGTGDLRLWRVKSVGHVTRGSNETGVSTDGGPATGGCGSGSRCGGSVNRGRAVIMRMVAENDPRESHGSLMVLARAICVMRLSYLDVMTRRPVSTGRVMVTSTPRPTSVMIRVICTTIVIVVTIVVVIVVILLLRLTLIVLFVLHSTILKPYLHLPLRKIQRARQFPTLLFRDVSVVKKFLLELERLILRVRLAFLPHRHLARPLERIRTTATDTHPCNAHPDPDTGKRTCRKQGRRGGTPHHLTQLECQLFSLIVALLIHFSY